MHLLWSASHYDGSLPECHSLTQVPDDGVNPKDKIIRFAVLSELPIDPRLQS